jgi:ammonia channel protein AmtB
MFVAIVGVVFMYKIHFFVERRFKIDDAVGAVAVHGYAGCFGVFVAGILLWGHPSSGFEGYAPITPWGQFIGAVIMFWVLGFLPAWVLCAILKGAGLLRIPREIELVGLDLGDFHGRYLNEDDVRKAEEEEARAAGLIT